MVAARSPPIRLLILRMLHPQRHRLSENRSAKHNPSINRRRKALWYFFTALVAPFLLQSIHGLLPNAWMQAQAQTGGAIQMKASRVEANSNTGVVTAIGNVRIDYPSRQIFATSAQAEYYSQEQRIVLSGNVDVLQEGNSLQAETVTYLITEGRFVATPGANSQVEAVYILPEAPATQPAASSAPSQPLLVPAVPDELPAELGPIDSPPSGAN